MLCNCNTCIHYNCPKDDYPCSDCQSYTDHSEGYQWKTKYETKKSKEEEERYREFNNDRAWN